MFNPLYNMSRFCAIFVLFCTLCQADNISLQYKAKLEFDNKKSDNELIGEYNAGSLCLCSTLCKNDCGFYGYNPLLKKCRLHKKVFNTGVSDEVGWKYYSYSGINTDCKGHFLHGQTQSGVYTINPFRNETNITVYCDMETEGGGWTAIQKRGSGSESFNRSWVDYQNGFGEANDSYWIGNDLIHELTKGNDSSLYISISLQNGNTFYERYQLFSIADETDDYRLLLGGPANGTLGDSMLNPNFQGKDLSGMPFSAPDRDNDKWGGGSCAAYREGGWWFNNCHWAFLNGPWAPAYWHNLWYPTVRNGDSVTEIKMLIKRH